MTVRNKLLATNESVPDRQFADKLLNVDRLLNVDKELYHVRATLAHATIDAIVLAWSECSCGSQVHGLTSNTGMSLFHPLICRSMLFECTCRT